MAAIWSRTWCFIAVLHWPLPSELTLGHHKNNNQCELCETLIVNLRETDEPWSYLCFHAHHQRDEPLKCNQPAFAPILITGHKTMPCPRASWLSSRLMFIAEICVQISTGQLANVILCDGLAGVIMQETREGINWAASRHCNCGWRGDMKQSECKCKRAISIWMTYGASFTNIFFSRLGPG